MCLLQRQGHLPHIYGWFTTRCTNINSHHRMHCRNSEDRTKTYGRRRLERFSGSVHWETDRRHSKNFPTHARKGSTPGPKIQWSTNQRKHDYIQREKSEDPSTNKNIDATRGIWTLWQLFQLQISHRKDWIPRKSDQPGTGIHQPSMCTVRHKNKNRTCNSSQKDRTVYQKYSWKRYSLQNR